MSDEELMQRFQRGDAGAFDSLLERHEMRVVAFIHRLTGDQRRTEAIGQEAFLQLKKEARTYVYPQDFSAWFYAIVRKACDRELRGLKRSGVG